MRKTKTATIVERELIKTRNNLIASLHKVQGYNYSQLGFIFNLGHTTILRILKGK